MLLQLDVSSSSQPSWVKRLCWLGVTANKPKAEKYSRNSLIRDVNELSRESKQPSQLPACVPPSTLHCCFDQNHFGVAMINGVIEEVTGLLLGGDGKGCGERQNRS